MKLKEQINEQQKIIDAAQAERDRLFDLQKDCKHVFEITVNNEEKIVKECQHCGIMQLYWRQF